MYKFLLAFLILLFPANAYAYIDPGTGSAIVYVIIGLVASAFYFFKGIFYKLIDLFSTRSFKREECHIAIHSEGRQYELVFLPILRELSKLGLDYTYITMYERDDGFDPLPEDAKHISIAPGIIGYSFLNKLRANLLVTTTPQLNVMTFKRSKKVKHYTMVQHALGEAMYMHPFPYDYYDSVMCCGPLLKKNIRYLETMRGQSPKILFEAGLAHYDELLARKKSVEKIHDRKTILVAPSWGELSIFQKFGTDFVETLSQKFEVIVRPHPQMRVSQTELFEKIKSLQGVEVDLNKTFEDSMARADLLISDFSGIIHEFAFIYEKPVIVAEYEKDLGSFEGHHFGHASEIAEKCGDFIVGVKIEDFHRLDERIDEILGRFSVETVRRIREELIYNYAKASQTIASHIAEIVE